MNSFSQFLNEHRIPSGDKSKPSTHTRIGDKELNIYGGNYHIPDSDMEEFNKLYYDYVIVNGNKEYLTERQLTDNGTFVVDLDFRYSHDISNRQHTPETIQNILCDYASELNKYFQFNNGDSFEVYVMEKPNVNRLADGSLTKDGIHLMFNLSVPYDIQMKIRESIIQLATDSADLPLINSFDSVFDDGITSGKTNWNLYGSRKPDNEAYEITQSFNFVYDKGSFEFHDFIFDKKDFHKISVRNKNPSFSLTKEGEKVFKAKETQFKPISSSPSPTGIADMYNKVNMSDIDYLLNICIQDNMCSHGKHKEWVIIGTALKNELGDEAVIPFVNWTNAFGTENKKNEAFIKITKEIKREKDTKNKKSVKIGTIHYWAKQYNSVKYIERFGNKAEMVLDNDIETAIETGTDYAFATYFKTNWGNDFKCIDIKAREYYAFNKNQLWEQFKDGSKIREVISNEMTKKFNDYNLSIQKYMNTTQGLNEEDTVYLQKKIKLVGEIAIKFGKTTDKDHIVRELSDKIKDVEFEKKLNRLEYVLPIKDGKVINLQTLKTEDRTINDNFSYECNANYIELTEEEETDIDKYLNELFCNNQETKKCVVNIIKSIFIGKPLRYIYFWTGSGSNGKSLFLKLLNCIFGKFMDTIDTNVILDKKITSALTTQFKKLDRCRVGYVTELKETDKLNEVIIKKITGGDAIDFRGLFKDNETINPTCNLMVVTNEMPNFDVEKAIVNRLIIVPFNNTFEVDMSFETKMMGKLDQLFSYIMKKGVICDKFELSQEMLYSKNNYVENNVKEDELECFIKEFIIVGETEKDCDNKPVYIKNTAFYEKFVSNNPKSRLTKNKITKEIKKFKIESKESNGSTTYRNCRWRTDDDNVEEE
jgi:P4 family phage/plasmid primase-like protien